MRKKLSLSKVLIAIILLIIALLILVFSYYNLQLAPVSKDDNAITVQIEKGLSGQKIAQKLKDNNLIRNVIVFRIYLKINNVNNLKHGVYDLNSNMGVKQLVNIMVKGTTLTGDEIDLLFREGINMRQVAQVIGNNTINNEADVFALMEDESYLDSLIEEYWFLTEEIKNKDIYYPLEGYLIPNTYRFENEDVTVERILTIMLRQMDKILSNYKDDIEASQFNIHEFLTFSSIVESEGVNDDDRPKIAGVFYNRLRDRWSFGSCVTACYAGKIDSCTPFNVPTTIISPYNTYLPSMAGKLPVGPISLPSEASIIASINPAEHHYYYFVSDKYNRTYFDKNEWDRNKTITKLKADNLWIEN